MAGGAGGGQLLNDLVDGLELVVVVCYGVKLGDVVTAEVTNDPRIVIDHEVGSDGNLKAPQSDVEVVKRFGEHPAEVVAEVVLADHRPTDTFSRPQEDFMAVAHQPPEYLVSASTERVVRGKDGVVAVEKYVHGDRKSRPGGPKDPE